MIIIIITIIISVLYIKYSQRERVSCATVVDVLSTVLMVFGCRYCKPTRVIDATTLRSLTCIDHIQSDDTILYQCINY